MNAVRTLFGSITTSGKSLDGLAVVSDIVASREPLMAAKRLRDAVSHFKAARTKFSSLDDYTTKSLSDSIGEALRYVRELSPLVHQVRCAQFGLKHPSMIKEDHKHCCDHTISECDDFTRCLTNYGHIPGRDGGPCENPWWFIDKLWDIDQPGRNDCGRYGLTTTSCFSEFTTNQGQSANQNRKPVVFDPVGVGATSFRKRTAAGTLWPQLTQCFKLTPFSRAPECVASHCDQG